MNFCLNYGSVSESPGFSFCGLWWAQKMTLKANPVFGKIGSDLVDLLSESSAFDASTNYIDIDRAWIYPKYRLQLVNIIMGAFKQVLQNTHPTSPSVIVCQDNLRRPFGLIPAAACAATQLNLNLAVWKESADFSTGLGRLYGPTEMMLDAFLWQDVVSSSGTLIKMQRSLMDTTWNLKAFFALTRVKSRRDRVESNLKILQESLPGTIGEIGFHFLSEVDQIGN